MNVIVAFKNKYKITIRLMDIEDAIRSDPFKILLSVSQWNRLRKKNMIDTSIMTSYPQKFMNEITNACYPPIQSSPDPDRTGLDGTGEE